MGLGSGAIPMAAAMQWVLKDGVGHAAAIVYATAVNTRFDADAKRYRRFMALVPHSPLPLSTPPPSPPKEGRSTARLATFLVTRVLA